MCFTGSTTFEKIVPDKVDLDQSMLDISDRTRVSLFAWNGQFSPQFIENLLTKYAYANDVVYDPFSGSGTVLRECSFKGLPAYGVELNPSAYFMSKFSELSNLPLSDRLELTSYFDSKLAELMISKNIASDFIDLFNQLPDGPKKDLTALIVILCDAYRNELSLQIIGKQWTKVKDALINLPFSEAKITSILGDARYTPIPDQIVSLIITSPPYINVFNYHQNYRRSIELLGFDVLKIAKSEFGSNRKNRSNRYLTVVQYTIDMALSLKECIRVSKLEARMIFIVGRESNVLSTRFCNSNILYRLATEIFQMDMALKQERHFKNRFGQEIYEDIIHLELTESTNRLLDEKQVIELARKIAHSVLTDALNYVDDERKELLEQAILKCHKVEKSEEAPIL